MRTLAHRPPAHYQVNAPKRFDARAALSPADIGQVFGFAYEMCFGQGHHRNVRTGGQSERSKGAMFCNTFQGKLAECALRRYLLSQSVPCSAVDYRVMGEQAWDDCDLAANGKQISIKSAAFFSNLLLLEQMDWDHEGRYLPNWASGRTSLYDFFALVRIKPDIKGILKKSRLFYADAVAKETLWALVSNERWQADLPGYITRRQLVHEVIRARHILPQGAILNGNTPMDAANYYVQAGDLHPIGGIVGALLP